MNALHKRASILERFGLFSRADALREQQKRQYRDTRKRGYEMDLSVENEIAFRLNNGCSMATKADVIAALLCLGYTLDTKSPCYYIGRYITGIRAGATYPGVSYRIFETDTKLSAFNIDARRDDKFKRMQEYRSIFFFVSNNSISDI